MLNFDRELSNMNEILTAKEIAKHLKKELPSISPIGIKYFQPDGSFGEAIEVQKQLKATNELLSYKKIQKIGGLSQATWHPDLQKAEVTHQIGSYWSTMGHYMDKKLYLHPEEALYLVEMGFLELMYNDVPMSVQRAYSALLKPKTSVSEENFRVYSQLIANGYKVLRHTTSNTLTKYEKQLQIHKAGIKIQSSASVKRNNPIDVEVPDCESKKLKLDDLLKLFPVTPNNLNDDDYLKKLQIFKAYKNKIPSNLSVHYDVYSSCDSKNSFKKTCLQLPQIRVIVHRGSDSIPDLKEIYHLMQQYEDEVPLVHAVVFPEYVSFYSITCVSTPACD